MSDRYCKRCSLNKPIDQFLSKNKKRFTKLCQMCRDDINLRNCEYYCEHKQYKFQCKICKGSTICEHFNQRHECLVCSPEYYLQRLTLRRIQKVLNLPSTNGINAESFLGCTLKHFKEYIELTFKPGMTWQNFGNLWEIDHRIPLKYNNPTVNEVVQRFHYTNTQALYTTENQIKGNRYIS